MLYAVVLHVPVFRPPTNVPDFNMKAGKGSGKDAPKAVCTATDAKASSGTVSAAASCVHSRTCAACRQPQLCADPLTRSDRPPPRRLLPFVAPGDFPALRRRFHLARNPGVWSLPALCQCQLAWGRALLRPAGPYTRRPRRPREAHGEPYSSLPLVTLDRSPGHLAVLALP